MRCRGDRRGEGGADAVQRADHTAVEHEIVVGKLVAGLVQYTTCLAAGLPVMILLPLLGGVDPRWVVLVYGATGSTAFFLAGLSILVSTAAQRGGRAVGETIGLAAAWCSLPILVHVLMPRTLPWLSPWVYPVNSWILASTPTGVLLAPLGLGPGWKFFNSIYWMMGLQFAAGTLMIAWAVVRFRASCRNQEGEGGYDGARSPGWFRARFLPRPACGVNPVLWKELHTARPRGLAHILGAGIALGLAMLIGYGTYGYAQPRLPRVVRAGSRSGDRRHSADRVQPVPPPRHLVGRVLHAPDRRRNRRRGGDGRAGAGDMGRPDCDRAGRPDDSRSQDDRRCPGRCAGG